MFNIPTINFHVVKKDKTSGVFEITPLVKGFGYTIGSALRRTLFSSTKGAAVTKVIIEGVPHEFSTIDGAKDDVLHLLLNIKKMRFRKTVNEPVELEFKKSGPGTVTAGDLEKVTGVEVINPDLVITELNSKKDLFHAKLTVESGYGYKQVDESVTIPIGAILLDANYSPIVNVIVQVDTTRVGRDDNYDKLVITVVTDGSVDAEEATRESAKALKEFFYKVQTGLEYPVEEDKTLAETEAETSQKSTSLDEISLEELRLPTRTINALRKAGIKTLAELADKPEDELLRVRNLGEKSIREIISLLEKEGLR